MSTSDGSSRPKFGDMLRSALSPRPTPDVDPNAPNPIPRTVKVSGVMIMVSGAINLAFGLYYILIRQSLVDAGVDFWNNEIDACRASGIGIGAEVTTTETSDQITQCKALAPLTQDMISGALQQYLLIGLVMAIVGAGSIVAGVGVFKGAVWARRLATPIGALLMIGTFLNLFASLPAFAATLLMIVGLTLLYVGKGANYFIRAKAKGLR
jgi:hypothetical protein